MASSMSKDPKATGLFIRHLSLLRQRPSEQDLQEITTTPIFTMPILKHAKALCSDDPQLSIPQYGLLAGMADELHGNETLTMREDQDPRIFFNIATPSSTFICGSQGSGKSHSLACLLENCLISSDASNLPRPLTGLVFHYDTFISDDGGSPCEAAFLSSHPQIKKTYHALNVQVDRLQIDPSDLNTKRMLDLMAVSRDDGPLPLYVHTVYRILRHMRVMQQETGGTFDYYEFKRQVADADLSPAQLGPLNQRLDTLESFMAPLEMVKKKGRKVNAKDGTKWISEAGYLTIVDLSCPCVTAEAACSLFNICLSIFLEQNMVAGRVIALDEAHKFMNASAEALSFTNTLLSTIRLQRHLGARIIISTQEPTVSPALLDLSSVTIVHRFTSPAWLRILRQHLAAASSDLLYQRPGSDARETESGADHPSKEKDRQAKNIFDDIVRLKIGEALLFAPSAVVTLNKDDSGDLTLERLGPQYLKIRVRTRITTDGGRSVMAS